MLSPFDCRRRSSSYEEDRPDDNGQRCPEFEEVPQSGCNGLTFAESSWELCTWGISISIKPMLEAGSTR
ncbi:hypothetical protein EYZ11_009699 [Aspergillus tanneri]|uniref:Uncharacterized protein n=1 Tax=Aspergillus tanneri TaxID=1220188 RepID=A0A4S3J9E6_9EURO|nr:hypothetical protein EYZ11_009699 [Aspergillus tanneri]